MNDTQDVDETQRSFDRARERRLEMAKPFARKTPSEQAAEETSEPVKICFERIIPDEVDPERVVRRRMRETLAATAGGDLDPEEMGRITRMALVNSKKWNAGSKLKCRFLDGSSKMRKKVEKIAHHWEKHANLRFDFVTSGPAEIRVSFYADSGSWSAVGRDALNSRYFPLHQPTMNYGWLRDDSRDDEYSRVVLHEFGHAIACVHEHQSPKFTRRWNTAAVMRYFQGPPNYWTPDDIRSNVLGKYSPSGVSATEFDPQSIMLYSFDGRLFADGRGATNSNTSLSLRDIKMIKEMYP
jgi:serralysin